MGYIIGYVITDGKFKVNDGYFKTQEDADDYLKKIDSKCDLCTKKVVERVNISFLPSCGMMWSQYGQ